MIGNLYDALESAQYGLEIIFKQVETLKNRHATFETKHVITEEIYKPLLSIWTDMISFIWKFHYSKR